MLAIAGTFLMEEEKTAKYILFSAMQILELRWSFRIGGIPKI